MSQPFKTWRQELTGELARARAELEEALGDHERALFGTRQANAAKGAIAKAFAQLPPSRQLASALLARRRSFEQGLDTAAGTLARVTNAIAHLRRRIGDLEQALQQLETISPPDEVAFETSARAEVVSDDAA